MIPSPTSPASVALTPRDALGLSERKLVEEMRAHRVSPELISPVVSMIGLLESRVFIELSEEPDEGEGELFTGCIPKAVYENIQRELAANRRVLFGPGKFELFDWQQVISRVETQALGMIQAGALCTGVPVDMDLTLWHLDRFLPKQ